MGTKAFLKGYQLASATSLATDFNSAVFEIPQKLSNIGIHIDCSSVTDNTGDFEVQHRTNDGSTQSGWADLDLSGSLTLANADKNFFANLNQIPPGDLRIVYTAAGAGTPDGTCDIWISGQEI